MEEITKTTQIQAVIKIYNVKYDGWWYYDVRAEKEVELGTGRKVKIIINASVADKYLVEPKITSDIRDPEKALFKDEYEDYKKEAEKFLQELKEILQVQ